MYLHSAIDHDSLYFSLSLCIYNWLKLNALRDEMSEAEMCMQKLLEIASACLTLETFIITRVQIMSWQITIPYCCWDNWKLSHQQPQRCCVLCRLCSPSVYEYRLQKKVFYIGVFLFSIFLFVCFCKSRCYRGQENRHGDSCSDDKRGMHAVCMDLSTCHLSTWINF